MSSLQKSKSLSLQAIRAESRNRDLEERIRTERRRNTLVLILRFLVDHGYTSSYEKLTQEAALSLKEFDACDNIFLYDIVAEFENFYEVKYGRKPKLVRKGNGGVSLPSSVATHQDSNQSDHHPETSQYVSGYAKARAMREKGKANMERAREQRQKGGPATSKTAAPQNGEVGKGNEDEGSDLGLGISISGTATGTTNSVGGAGGKGEEEEGTGNDASDFYSTFLLKPMPDMGSSELSDLAATITRDIYVRSPNVKWEDISGLHQAKQLLKEAVVFPHKFPHLFKVSQVLIEHWATARQLH